jgi:hypothetical protein
LISSVCLLSSAPVHRRSIKRSQGFDIAACRSPANSVPWQLSALVTIAQSAQDQTEQALHRPLLGARSAQHEPDRADQALACFQAAILWLENGPARRHAAGTEKCVTDILLIATISLAYHCL